MSSSSSQLTPEEILKVAVADEGVFSFEEPANGLVSRRIFDDI